MTKYLVDVDFETIIRENNWRYCDKCEYKTKSKRCLKIHIAFNCISLPTLVKRNIPKQAPTNFQEPFCEICDYRGENLQQINNHILYEIFNFQ